eukprot:EG_transcript_17614
MSSIQLMAFYVDTFRDVLQRQPREGAPEAIDLPIVLNFVDSMVDIIRRLKEALELRDREIALWRAEHELFHDALTVLARQLQSGGSSLGAELSAQALLDLVSDACYKYMASQSVLAHDPPNNGLEAELVRREAEVAEQTLSAQRATTEVAARRAEVAKALQELAERQEKCKQWESKLVVRERALTAQEELQKQEGMGLQLTSKKQAAVACQCYLALDEEEVLYTHRMSELLAREERLEARATAIETELRRRAQEALEAEVRAQLAERRLQRRAGEVEA